MRVLTTFVTICLVAIFGINTPALAATTTEDLGRQTLAPNDGWAAFGTNKLGQPGTTGGASADAEHVYVVSTWQEFRDALGGSSASGNTTPRIIYVQGEINANTTPDGKLLTCDDYADPAYSLTAYLAAYDPATWGRTAEPKGALEDARARSATKQAAQIRQDIGSNVTIVGLGDDARFVNASLRINGSDNVIIRNIEFSDAYDCFPQWDPTDGSTGNWNSAYDNVWIRNSTHVWVDHSTFNDGQHPGDSLPTYFGRKFEVHDGLLDITNAADLVTVSYNRFEDHDKTMLIGSSDSGSTALNDQGKLRVTIHHNLFANTGQRAPRVRFGQVHVFNNYYDIPNSESYTYSWGVGLGSKIYAENNYFHSASVTPDQFIRSFRGTAIHATGTLVNGVQPTNRVDVLRAYNAVNDPDLAANVGWTPTLYTEVHPTQAVPGLVLHQAGTFTVD